MNIDSLRLRAGYVITAAAILLGLAGMAVEYLAQGRLGLASALTLGCAAILGATWLAARDTQAYRYTAVSVLMAQVMAMLIAARGYPWQMDLHMIFFAALVLCALMYDVKAIVLGTVLIAVHHLGVGMTAETLVFYGGASLGRVALHASVVVAAAGGLIWLTINTERLLTLANGKSAEAASEARKVREMAEESATERTVSDQRHRAMIQQLQGAMGSVVEAAIQGNLSRRVESSFSDPELNTLAGSLNTLVETVERGLGETGDVLAALAGSNLTRRVEGEYEGTFGALKVSTNSVAERLSETVQQLRQSSRSLRSATGELLSGANDLSDRTNKQAATIAETSATIVQVAQAVAHNAKRAQQASAVAGSVQLAADEGGKVMQQATAAMERITASSAKISNIIGLIDDVAFQTNLLALNASVEAARAGDAGKGFAVVAVEVRRLAQSAAQASSEVKHLVELSTDEVRGGSSLVGQVASKLDVMLAAARSSNELMDGIARESQEQAAAIEQVSAAVRELDDMTHHNSALVEETNATLAQAEIQARELDRLVATFTLRGAVADDPTITRVERRDRAVRRPADPGRYRTAGNAALDEDWSAF